MHASHRFALFLSLALSLPALTQTLPLTRPHPAYPGAGATVSVATLRVPSSAWDHFAKARQADLAGSQPDFDREFERALAIEPNFGALYLLRASRHMRFHHFDAALADVLAAQRIEPHITAAGTILAGIYNGLHRFDDALLVLNTLHGAEAGSWQVAYELTRAYLGRGDANQALRTSALTITMAPETCHEAVLLRANALSAAHRTLEAVDHFRLYLTFNPAPTVAAQVQHAIDLLDKQPAPRPDTEVASN